MTRVTRRTRGRRAGARSPAVLFAGVVGGMWSPQLVVGTGAEVGAEVGGVGVYGVGRAPGAVIGVVTSAVAAVAGAGAGADDGTVGGRGGWERSGRTGA